MGVVALTSQSLEFHRSGKLRILAVTSPERLIAAPELPTVAEGSFPALSRSSALLFVHFCDELLECLEERLQARRSARAARASSGPSASCFSRENSDADLPRLLD
jgi:hypothetical protein